MARTARTVKRKRCCACGRRRLLKFFYRRSQGCKDGPGLPFSECKTCHGVRTNEIRRRLRATSPRFRKLERAAHKRWRENQRAAA